MDTQTVSYPKFMRLILLLCIPLFIFYAVVVKYDNPLYTIFFWIFILWTAITNYSYSIKITYNDEGITIKQVFRSTITIRWEDIDQMRGKLLGGGGVVFFDSTENKLFSLDNNLEGAEDFIKILTEKRPKLFRVTIGEKIQLNMTYHLYLVSVFIILGILFMVNLRLDNSMCGSVLGISVIGVGVFNILATTRGITFERDKLVLKSLVKTRIYHIQNIETIGLKLFFAAPGWRQYKIVLEQKEGKPKPIQLQGRNNFILYQKLHSWLETHKPPTRQ
jgi:hypothetical protein